MIIYLPRTQRDRKDSKEKKMTDFDGFQIDIKEMIKKKKYRKYFWLWRIIYFQDINIV